MKLYHFPNSSFSEKIRRVLAHKGIEYEAIDATVEEKRAELIAVSGQKLVPVIVDGEKVVIDSTTIAQYLEEKHPQWPIYPTGSQLKGLTLLIEDWADEVLNKVVRPLALSYQRGEELPADVRETLINNLNTHLSTLDQALSGKKWLVADAFTLADIAVYAQIWRITQNPTVPISSQYRELLSWKRRVEGLFKNKK